MNKEWSELNKQMQTKLKKKDTYDEGIATLFELRNQLWDTILSYKKDLKREDFDAIPYINADGYHSKTIAYSLWHIFRIEDIVIHTLIKGDEQVFFRKGYHVLPGGPAPASPPRPLLQHRGQRPARALRAERRHAPRSARRSVSLSAAGARRGASSFLQPPPHQPYEATSAPQGPALQERRAPHKATRQSPEDGTRRFQPGPKQGLALPEPSRLDKG